LKKGAKFHKKHFVLKKNGKISKKHFPKFKMPRYFPNKRNSTHRRVINFLKRRFVTRRKYKDVRRALKKKIC